MIENTTDRDPLLHLLGAMSDGTSDYITGMEADGQRQFVGSEQMPSRSPIAELEALGFVFGDPDPRDPLFRPCTLPTGWVKRRTGHDMWSEIVDDKGRKRVSIFYKAAFYDRDAFDRITPPTSGLSDAIWGDQEPQQVKLDELLTAAVAREFLREQLEHEQKYLPRMREAGHDVSDDEARIARIERLQELVEQAVSA